jgi:hypothetical protein
MGSVRLGAPKKQLAFGNFTQTRSPGPCANRGSRGSGVCLSHWGGKTKPKPSPALRTNFKECQKDMQVFGLSAKIRVPHNYPCNSQSVFRNGGSNDHSG